MDNKETMMEINLTESIWNNEDSEVMNIVLPFQTIEVETINGLALISVNMNASIILAFTSASPQSASHSTPLSEGGKTGVKNIPKADIPRLPYNKKLTEHAKELRKNMTPAEKKIWYEVLRNRQFENLRWLRQRPIDNFIVDFYCAELKLILEIDGDSHFTEDNMIYDKERTKILEQYGLTLIRFTNKEVMQNLSGVYQALLQQIAEKKKYINLREKK